MRQGIRYVMIVGLMLALSASAWGAGLKLPPGKWWQNPRLVERLGLTKAQQDSIRQALYRHAEAMIDLNAAVRHRELELMRLVEADQWNEQQVRAAFAALQQARSKLEQERFDLLLEVRKVLTAEQWNELRQMRRDRPGRRPQPRMRPQGPRPAGPPPGEPGGMPPSETAPGRP